MMNDETAMTTPAIDVAALLERCENNAAVARRLAARFVREAPTQIAVLHDVLQSGNAAELARLLHKLRGSLGIFGATLAHDTAAALEARAGGAGLAGCETMLADLDAQVQRACGALAAFGT